jgi:hypothetical protein
MFHSKVREEYESGVVEIESHHLILLMTLEENLGVHSN